MPPEIHRSQGARARMPVSEAVFVQLCREILGGRLQPGDSLRSERALADAFGVSRHAVREAVKRLQQAGLVEVSQGGATCVLDWRVDGGLDLLPRLSLRARGPVDPKVLRSALEMRISIGADAARLCARRAVPPLPDELFRVVSEMERTDNVETLVDLDTEFWGLVVDGADNIAYRLAFNSLMRALEIHRRPAMALITAELLDPAARRSVATAIAGGDEEAAAQQTRAALSGGLETALDLLSAAR
jgi:GntR family transcriptional regulator, transcriptional repressor for pyruvate dehydrogenase complex